MGVQRGTSGCCFFTTDSFQPLIVLHKPGHILKGPWNAVFLAAIPTLLPGGSKRISCKRILSNRISRMIPRLPAQIARRSSKWDAAGARSRGNGSIELVHHHQPPPGAPVPPFTTMEDLWAEVPMIQDDTGSKWTTWKICMMSLKCLIK